MFITDKPLWPRSWRACWYRSWRWLIALDLCSGTAVFMSGSCP